MPSPIKTDWSVTASYAYLNREFPDKNKLRHILERLFAIRGQRWSATEKLNFMMLIHRLQAKDRAEGRLSEHGTIENIVAAWILSFKHAQDDDVLLNRFLPLRDDENFAGTCCSLEQIRRIESEAVAKLDSCIASEPSDIVDVLTTIEWPVELSEHEHQLSCYLQDLQHFCQTYLSERPEDSEGSNARLVAVTHIRLEKLWGGTAVNNPELQQMAKELQLFVARSSVKEAYSQSRFASRSQEEFVSALNVIESLPALKQLGKVILRIDSLITTTYKDNETLNDNERAWLIFFGQEALRALLDKQTLVQAIKAFNESVDPLLKQRMLSLKLENILLQFDSALREIIFTEFAHHHTLLTQATVKELLTHCYTSRLPVLLDCLAQVREPEKIRRFSAVVESSQRHFAQIRHCLHVEYYREFCAVAMTYLSRVFTAVSQHMFSSSAESVFEQEALISGHADCLVWLSQLFRSDTGDERVFTPKIKGDLIHLVMTLQDINALNTFCQVLEALNKKCNSFTMQVPGFAAAFQVRMIEIKTKIYQLSVHYLQGKISYQDLLQDLDRYAEYGPKGRNMIYMTWLPKIVDALKAVLSPLLNPSSHRAEPSLPTAAALVASSLWQKVPVPDQHEGRSTRVSTERIDQPEDRRNYVPQNV